MTVNITKCMFAFSPESISEMLKVTRASVTKAGTGVKVTIVGVNSGQLSLTSVIITCNIYKNLKLDFSSIE